MDRDSLIRRLVKHTGIEKTEREMEDLLARGTSLVIRKNKTDLVGGLSRTKNEKDLKRETE